MPHIENQDFYDRKWRKLSKDEDPKPGDVWFPGGPCQTWKPRVLEAGVDCFDPVGMCDGSIYRKPAEKTKK